MAFIKIAVVNHSTVVGDAEAKSIVQAVQTQVHRDFAPLWGVDADLAFVAGKTKPDSSAWLVGIFDDADQAGALGYHDLTTKGLPLGKVFARTTLKDGGKVSVTFSHEVLEMLGDPDINLSTFVPLKNGQARLYAYEVCDAVEADRLGYAIGGVTVSDFVTPAWFETFRKAGSADFSFRRSVRKPLELAPGGYIGIFDITGGQGWQQITAKGAPLLRARAPVGSRRERRRIPKDLWRTSRA